MSRALNLAVHARDPVRRAGLLSLLAAAGHATGVAEDAADLLVWDLGPGEAPAAAGGLPVVLLADRPHFERDARFAAVLARAVAPETLLAALAAVAAGLMVRLPGADLPGAESPEPGFRAAEEGEKVGLLTPREVDILRAVGDGLSNKEVARRLGISAHTVKFHLEAIFDKLGAGSRAEAVAKGLRRGVIEL